MVDPIDKIKANATSLATSTQEKPIILAAIDIGTNSIHMAIVEIDPALASFSIIAREKDTVRLGDRDPKTGNLTPEAMERAIATLHRCLDLAKSANVDQIVALATSATREAPNRQEFLDKIESEVGIVVNLISGQEEARRIYLGVLSGMDFQDRPHVIIDIGGGSTELILADPHEARFLSSTKIGAVRLTREFINSDPIDEFELAYLRVYVRGMLERVAEELRCYIKPDEQPRLVGTSGTIETLATLHALEKNGEVPNPLNGYQMSRKDVKKALDRLAGLNYEQRAALPGMSEKRAEIIIAGAVILYEAMSLLRLDALVICERSLREGAIVDWMLTHGLIDSRMRYQSEVRERSAIKIASKYQVNLEYGDRIARFALSLFDQMQGLHSWSNEERFYISHNAYHKHSYYLIRNAELLGFTEIELEIIANVARYHRKSKPKKKHEAYNKLPDRCRAIIKQLAAILRIAVALDRRQIGAIAEFECKYDSEYKTLHLHLFAANSEDDCALELWNLDYEKPVFEEEFNVKLVATLAIGSATAG
jgi:exopolyphosphatase / guanosine-5'-triphosphate,3'-diphosphate pyrophosphatase